MAPSFASSQSTERGFAHGPERNLPQEGALHFLADKKRSLGFQLLKLKYPSQFIRSRDSDGSSPGAKEVIKLPGTTAGLIAVCTFIGVGILCIITWRCFWKVKKRKLASTQYALRAADSSEQQYLSRLALVPSLASSPPVSWQSVKISPWVDSSFPMQPPTAISRVSTASSATYIETKSALNQSHDTSPNAEQMAFRANHVISHSHQRPSQLSEQNSIIGANSSKSISNGEDLLIPCVDCKTTQNTVHPNVPKDEIGIKQTLTSNITKELRHLTRSETTNLKLVTVIQTFPTSLPDELNVTVGETLHLVKEFQDGWCLCERVHSDTATGVVPICCLAEVTAIGTLPRPSDKSYRNGGALDNQSSKILNLKRAQSLGSHTSPSSLRGSGPRQHHLNPRVIRIG